jgi:hypothetical protein
METEIERRQPSGRPKAAPQVCARVQSHYTPALTKQDELDLDRQRRADEKRQGPHGCA